MRSVAVGRPRLGWHPLVGAALLAVPCAFIAWWALSGRGVVGAGAPAGVTAFLTMGAVAGFSVSGST